MVICILTAIKIISEELFIKKSFHLGVTRSTESETSQTQGMLAQQYARSTQWKIHLHGSSANLPKHSLKLSQMSCMEILSVYKHG